MKGINFEMEEIFSTNKQSELLKIIFSWYFKNDKTKNSFYIKEVNNLILEKNDKSFKEWYYLIKILGLLSNDQNWILCRLWKNFKLFLKDTRKSEKPDFIVETKNLKIGIEISELIRENDAIAFWQLDGKIPLRNQLKINDPKKATKYNENDNFMVLNDKPLIYKPSFGQNNNFDIGDNTNNVAQEFILILWIKIQNWKNYCSKYNENYLFIYFDQSHILLWECWDFFLESAKEMLNLQSMQIAFINFERSFLVIKKMN